MKKSQLIGGAFHYTRWPFTHYLDTLKKLDIHAIEFYAASPHMYPDDYTVGMAYELKKQMEERDVEAHVITTEQCSYPISICCDDPFMRERSLRVYEKTLELGHALGAKTMQVMGGYYNIEEGEHLPELQKRAKEGIYRIAKYAASLDMQLVLEADPPSAIKNCKDIRNFLDDLKQPNVYGMIDFGASWTCNEDFEEAVKILGKDLRHIHLNDVKDMQPCFAAGRGDIPLYDWFDILDKYNYQYDICPEYWGTKYVFEADEVLEETVNYFNAYIDSRNKR